MEGRRLREGEKRGVQLFSWNHTYVIHEICSLYIKIKKNTNKNENLRLCT